MGGGSYADAYADATTILGQPPLPKEKAGLPPKNAKSQVRGLKRVTENEAQGMGVALFTGGS